MIELFRFQKEAASKISDRFAEYYPEPVEFGRGVNRRQVPFYQALSSITGSGKTAILAQAVNEISAMTEIAPVILWLSKGKVVVQQSYANLAGGGKYNHLLGNTAVQLLSAYNPEDVAQSNAPLLYFATVGTFNQKDKEKSNLRIFAEATDIIQTSRWDALKERHDDQGRRRPLIVVYDEAQNLSDQQTDLLLEQHPSAFLLASATLQFPAQFNTVVIDQLKKQGDYKDDDLITPVTSSVVVESGLIKGTISLDGLNSPLEETIAEMLSDMREAEQSATNLGLSFRPKAIYVCNTNRLADDATEVDSPKQSFDRRQAPPIIIWRYLTEQQNIPPEDIAVYADLKTHKDHPLPPEFNLFSGGERDYEDFVEGNYRHIIFNKTLQEGWDDPTVYFAYIDKSMDSTVQITQIVGRVLRQPGVRHYPDERLNTAHFYIRVDHNEAFAQVVQEVQKGLGGDGQNVRVLTSSPGKSAVESLIPKEDRSVPRAVIIGDLAKNAIARVLETVHDYTDDVRNTTGEGRRRTVHQVVGQQDAKDSEWSSFFQSSRVNARWVFRRQVARQYTRALGPMNTEDPKFDAKVGVGSTAYKELAAKANEAVNSYLEYAIVRTTKPNPYLVGAALVRRDDMVPFNNALHEGYDRLNSLELHFAHALDKTGMTWARNPSQTGYKIPLVTLGTTENFFPDFLVWTEGAVVCIDTKGDHLIEEDARRKLLEIKNGKRVDIQLRLKLVTGGQWTPDGARETKDGYTMWELGSGRALRTLSFDTLDELLEVALADPQ